MLQQLGTKVRVSMIVETDREDIRKHFAPYVLLLAEFGIPAQVAIALVLPSSKRFAEILRPLVNRVCIDDYFMGDGSGGKRTHKDIR